MAGRTILAAVLGMCLLLAAPVAADVFNMPGDLTSLEFVTIGDPGNADDNTPAPVEFGNVDYLYDIGTYEITAGQYTEFLNAVAVTDPHSLYSPLMALENPLYYSCKITQTGADGTYSYLVDPEYANRPVVRTSWGDAARFVNWMHNGQPTGLQDASTTEDGAYFLNGATTDAGLQTISTRNANARYAIPSEDEWYKAAFYDGNRGVYYDYAMGSDAIPSNDLTDPDPGNNANFYQDEEFVLGDPYWATEVGEFENSASPYGTYDQGGNVWEWNESAYTPNMLHWRTLRGGSFWKLGIDWLVSHRRSGNYGSLEDYGVGFRIAKLYVGDFDGDGDVDAHDIDNLCDHLTGEGVPVAQAKYDLDGDGDADTDDLDMLIHELVMTTVGVGTEYGDFNLDGLIDNTDLTILATYYGTGTSWAEGNANRYLDLVIDNTDLTILATYYGFGTPDVVPEPASASLLLLGASVVLRRRRKA